MIRNIIASVLAEYKKRKNDDIILICSSARSGSTALFRYFSQHPKVTAYNESRILFSIFYFLIPANRISNLNKRSEFLKNELQKIYYRYKFNNSIRNIVANINKTIVEKEAFDIIGLPDYNYEEFMREMLRLFPNIKIVFVIRHPVNTINSMLKRKWGYSLSEYLKQEPVHYSLDECITIWKTSAESAKNLSEQTEFRNRFLIFKFEDLIETPELISTQLCHFTGLTKFNNFEPAKISDVDLEGKIIQTIHKEAKSLMDYYGY